MTILTDENYVDIAEKAILKLEILGTERIQMPSFLQQVNSETC